MLSNLIQMSTSNVVPMGTATTPPTAITPEMLQPVIDGVITNVGVIMPAAIGLFAIVLGIKFVPKIFKWFTK